MQIGNWSTAYFTVSIAVHTFNSLVLQRRQSILVAGITISIGWISAAILGKSDLVVNTTCAHILLNPTSRGPFH